LNQENVQGESRIEPITELLLHWRSGQKKALDQLIPKVYQQLKQVARFSLRAVSNRKEELRATALIHEAYLRLVAYKDINWQDRKHFFSMMGLIMRRILVEEARRQSAKKRELGNTPVHTLPEPELVQDLSVIQINDALDDMAQINKQWVSIVELKFFVGLTNEETAAVMKVSSSTVKRQWNIAKAWIYDYIQNKKDCN